MPKNLPATKNAFLVVAQFLKRAKNQRHHCFWQFSAKTVLQKKENRARKRNFIFMPWVKICWKRWKVDDDNIDDNNIDNVNVNDINDIIDKTDGNVNDNVGTSSGSSKTTTMICTFQTRSNWNARRSYLDGFFIRRDKNLRETFFHVESTKNSFTCWSSSNMSC